MAGGWVHGVRPCASRSANVVARASADICFHAPKMVTPCARKPKLPSVSLHAAEKVSPRPPLLTDSSLPAGLTVCRSSSRVTCGRRCASTTNPEFPPPDRGPAGCAAAVAGTLPPPLLTHSSMTTPHHLSASWRSWSRFPPPSARLQHHATLPARTHFRRRIAKLQQNWQTAILRHRLARRAAVEVMRVVVSCFCHWCCRCFCYCPSPQQSDEAFHRHLHVHLSQHFNNAPLPHSPAPPSRNHLTTNPPRQYSRSRRSPPSRERSVEHAHGLLLDNVDDSKLFVDTDISFNEFRMESPPCRHVSRPISAP